MNTYETILIIIGMVIAYATVPMMGYVIKMFEKKKETGGVVTERTVIKELKR
jgi:flagellar basal body-associated protein FliL